MQAMEKQHLNIWELFLLLCITMFLKLTNGYGKYFLYLSIYIPILQQVKMAEICTEQVTGDIHPFIIKFLQMLLMYWI